MIDKGAPLELRRICAKTHAAPVFLFLELLFLLRQDCDNRIRGVLVNLCRACFFHPAHVPCKFNNSQLETITEPEIRDVMLPCILYCLNLSLNARTPKPSRDNNCIISRKFIQRFWVLLKFLAIQPPYHRPFPIIP